jgi:dTDP-4-dehydrorhamnose reductase
MRKVLLTGAAGLLGRRLLATPGSLWRIVPTDITDMEDQRFLPCDITDPDAVAHMTAHIKPDVIIHSAAMTNVDGCERGPEAAERVNLKGTAHLTEAARKLGARLVFISTDYVFDGRSGPYSEDDQVNPIGVYGKTKWNAEELIRTELPDNHLICRTNVLYGYNPHVRPNYFTWLIEKLSAGEAVRIVTDQFNNPTLADNLTRMIFTLVEAEAGGTYHTAGNDYISRYDMAVMLADVFGFSTDLIEPITTAELGQDANRPAKGGLKIDKLKREFPSLEITDLRSDLITLKKQIKR